LKYLPFCGRGAIFVGSSCGPQKSDQAHAPTKKYSWRSPPNLQLPGNQRQSWIFNLFHRAPFRWRVLADRTLIRRLAGLPAALSAPHHNEPVRLRMALKAFRLIWTPNTVEDALGLGPPFCEI